MGQEIGRRTGRGKRESRVMTGSAQRMGQRQTLQMCSGWRWRYGRMMERGKEGGVCWNWKPQGF